MEWLQVLTIAGSTIGACWYFKRDTDFKIDQMMRDANKKFEEMSKEFKEFHGRLCTLEERHFQMMQRILEGKNKKN